MTDFDNYDQLPAVAQNCRHYASDRKLNSRHYGAQEGVTCSSCRNWDGASCVRNAFDSVITRLDG